MSWHGSREAAQGRLDQFLPHAGRAYASTRNYDLGPNDRSNISCLSPWIRHRLLLEEEVIRQTLSLYSLRDSEKFIQEVFWRTYFKGWLEHRPDVWFHYRKDVIDLLDKVEKQSDLRSRYENAIAGKTGIACFDAWADELLENGYLHNHARMWFASIWIFTLHLPWQLGADFLYRHLLDGDPASNTLSWRWVAGLHTKGKHYVALKSNIEKFTEGRFSPPNLAIDPLPLSEEVEFSIKPIPENPSIANPEPFGLIVTEEDCNPESLPLPGNPLGACCLMTTESRSPLKVSEPARMFAERAISDAADRAEICFGFSPSHSAQDEWAEILVNWAKELRVSTLVTAYAPMGPVREKLDAAGGVLRDAGISLVEIRREYDSVCWPHASRGFFKLKQKIPDMLKVLDGA